jgi:two-component system repressor protein LuxO
MPAATAHILIVEDVAALAHTYEAYLRDEAATIKTVACAGDALDHIARERVDAVVLDVNLPDMTGLDMLQELRTRGYDGQVIVVTSNGSINVAVEAMRYGAFDFIVKPFTADRLRVTTRNALDKARLSRTIEQIREEFGRDSFCGFIGNSLKMQAVYRIVQSAAASKATVFITGESGTGKEVCAEALHQCSPRSGGPFVAINCAAIPGDLLESELFGHVKGAFTGASAERAGAVLSADGGTLFLDEIGEMDVTFQAKLLRFIETGAVQRVGEDQLRRCDVRIVCATNRDPFAEVEAGRFREDLLYRLHVIPIDMPALRERESDILSLAEHFLQTFAKEDGKSFTGFSTEAQDQLLRYDWPGNVRQLKNVIRKIVVLCNEGTVEASDLPLEVQRTSGSSHSTLHRPASISSHAQSGSDILPLETQIDTAIDRAILQCGGSIPKAAAALKVSPSTIYRRLNSRGGNKHANA